jgi:hypothetical protein
VSNTVPTTSVPGLRHADAAQTPIAGYKGRDVPTINGGIFAWQGACPPRLVCREVWRRSAAPETLSGALTNKPPPLGAVASFSRRMLIGRESMAEVISDPFYALVLSSGLGRFACPYHRPPHPVG